MARPENRSEARALSLTLPIETFNYLVLLATLGKLGRTENEVATHILVREAYAMFERGFHEERIPAADVEQEFRVGGDDQREEYLLRAAELSARAQAESDAARKVEFENMARAYLRLAEQAKRNSLTDIVYETPPKKDYDPA